MQALLHFKAPSMLLSAARRRTDVNFGCLLSTGKSLWTAHFLGPRFLYKSPNAMKYKKFSTIDLGSDLSIPSAGSEDDGRGVHPRWNREYEDLGNRREYDEYPNVDIDWQNEYHAGATNKVVYQDDSERFTAPIRLAYEESFVQNDWEKEWLSREEMLKRSFLLETRHWRGLIRLPTGDTMQGEWKDGVLVGSGTLKMRKGATYVGGYNNDHQRWKGKIIFKNGNTQEGEWINGRPFGSFVATTKDGTVFEGTCTGDHSWHGRISHSSGEQYEGDFWHGYRHGHGSQRNALGHTYVGSWKMGQLHGSGTLTVTDGMYEGDFRHDKRHGYGMCKFPNGTYYEGEWENGHMHGVGKRVSATGMTYEGEFRNSWRHGHGHVTYKDGSQYVGNVRYNLRCGQGTFTHFNGDVYSGEWLDDMKHGQGVLVFPDGRKLEGEFRYALPYNTRGTLITQRGTVYEGTWVQGLREGAGRIVYANGEFIEGEFRANLPWNAKGTFQPTERTETGERLRGEWKEGELVTDYSGLQGAPRFRSRSNYNSDDNNRHSRRRRNRHDDYYD